MTKTEQVKKETFLKNLHKAGGAVTARFLGIDSDDLLDLIFKCELGNRLSKEYDDICEHELDAFEREMMDDLNARDGKNPRWAQIRHDHREESDGFLVGYVDAWLTANEDDDEEGKVIAQVVGAVIDGKPSVFVVHCDPEARFDDMAKEAIAECSADILEELTPDASDETIISRRDDTYVNRRVITLFGRKKSESNTVSLATITVADSPAGYTLPQIEIADGLEPKLKDRVEKTLVEILQEHTN